MQVQSLVGLIVVHNKVNRMIIKKVNFKQIDFFYLSNEYSCGIIK